MKTWILACSMALLGTGLHAAQIPAAADSSISSKKLTAKLGGGKTLTVDKQTNAMIRFDLSSLSSDVKAANVSKATLRLWINAKPTPGSLAVALPGAAWAESLVSGSTAPGFVPTGVTKVLPAEGNAYFDLDMTEVVKSWLGGSPNNGLVLTPEIAGNPLKVVFDSRESTKPGRGPILDIEIVELPVFRTFEFDIPAAAWDVGFHYGDDNVHRSFLGLPVFVWVERRNDGLSPSVALERRFEHQVQESGASNGGKSSLNGSWVTATIPGDCLPDELKQRPGEREWDAGFSRHTLTPCKTKISTPVCLVW